VRESTRKDELTAIEGDGAARLPAQAAMTTDQLGVGDATDAPRDETTQAATASGPRLLLTVREAAHALGVGRSTAYELITTGELEVVHIGRACRIPVAVVEAYVERLRPSRNSNGVAVRPHP
jgi:excisionase family DNA binding protein